jgi:hypothetical protein
LAQAIHAFIANDKLHYSVWVDGLALPALISDFRNGKYRTFPQSEEQANLLETKFIEVVGYDPSSDATRAAVSNGYSRGRYGTQRDHKEND